MTDVNAERDAQIIAWLTKKAREYDATPGRDNRIAAGVALNFASKIRRGAVRANNLLTLPASADPAPEWQDADDIELARLRTLVTDMHAAATGRTGGPLLGYVEDMRGVRDAVDAQLHRADTLNRLAQEHRAENERLRSELATQWAATLREATALCRANDTTVPTASDAARTAAAEILAGAAAGTLGPIRDCTVDGDIVRFRIRPTNLAEWEQWLDILEVPAGRVTSHGGYSTAHGRWGTTEVVLLGHGVGAMQAAQLRAELAERSTGGAR